MLDRVLLAAGSLSPVGDIYVEAYGTNSENMGGKLLNYEEWEGAVTLGSGFCSSAVPVMDFVRIWQGDKNASDTVLGYGHATGTGSTREAEIRFTVNGRTVGVLFSYFYVYNGPQIPGMEYKWETRVSKL